MTETSSQGFRRVVTNIVSPALTQLGYIQSGFQLLDDDDYSIPFGKMIVEGICCLIDFQRSRHFIPPISKFQVFLMREQLIDSIKSNERYAPLGIDLPNIMKGLYHQDIFAPKTYTWQFVDEQGLIAGLDHALSLTLKYGISWLEDPNSNMDWTKVPPVV